ncbi:MAG: hypothetical protein JSS54_17820, partial [Proteobacteria bacterium]|nr:hypothetical protein [Pseudomonadota bacterium]
MRIFLDDDDCPNARDRDAAARIVEEIVLDDVVTKGSFVIEGYSAARRIAQALTAARVDERRLSLETPMPMRGLTPETDAEAVMAKWPALHPLYHWLTVDGMQFH